MVILPTSPKSRSLAALVLAAALLLPGAGTRAADPVDGGDRPGTPGATATPAPAETKPDDEADPTALRIRYLHGRLRVTPAQEAAWAKVTQALRDNVKAMTPLLRERLRTTREGSAPDVLAAYQRVNQAQMAGLNRFTEAFRPFYAILSSSQKKTADILLRQAPLETMISGIPQAPLPSLSSVPPYAPVVTVPPLPPPALGAANPVYPTTPSYPIFTPTYPPAVSPLSRPWLGGGFIGPPVILPPLRHFDHPHRFHHPGDPHPFHPGEIRR